jgi:Fe-S cluster assembly protein SufD
MTATTDLATGTPGHGLTEHSHGAGVPASSRAERVLSFDVADFPRPGGREEEWRFTPLDRIGDLLDGVPSAGHLTWSTTVPDGVVVDSVAAADPLLRAVPTPVDRLAALAMDRAGGAVVVRIPAGTSYDQPVSLRLAGALPDGDAGQPVWGQLVIEVGERAEATVVLEHTGLARYAAAVSVLVGDGARLRLVGVQDWAGGSVHSVHVGFRVGQDASVRSTQVSLGGDLVRVVETVEYTGPGGDADLAGIYFADAGQHLEHRLFVDHAVPHCRSNVVYKGALQGEQAHSVWVGDVLIRAVASGTDTYELNRNLVLTDGARADSVPNLEIETGEIVGAGHASATGRFDDEQLFYLQARGIPADEARRLVVRGFFAELIQRIGVPEVEERLLGAIEAELERSMGAAPTPVGGADTPVASSGGGRA